MKALGLIETKGIIASIESADAMLKSADVSLMEKVKVGGGIITVYVTGDVSAVQTAVSAGAAAVERLGAELLLSTHVIPRPHDDMELIIRNKTNNTPNDKEKPVEDKKAHIVFNDNINTDTPNNDIKIKSVSTDIETITKIEDVHPTNLDDNSTNTIVEDENTNSKTENISSETIKDEKINTTPSITKSEFIENDNIKLDVGQMKKADIDKIVKTHGVDKTMKHISKAKITKLKSILEDYSDIKENIKKLDKKTILNEIRKYYENNM